MTEADVRLKDLFAQDAPPARDPAFSAAVMQKIVRRRFAFEVAWLTGVTALGGLVLWAVWPLLAALVADHVSALGPVAACTMLAAAAVLLIEGRSPASILRT